MAVRVSLLSLGLVLFAASAAAQDPFHCWSNARFDDLNDISSMIHQAAQIDYPDREDKDRKQDFEFARDHKESVQTIRDRYAATGDFHCGNINGQAQLTVRNNVITTAAHLLFKAGTCTPITDDYSKCKITLVVKGKVRTASVKRIMNTGYKCSDKYIPANLDWAVVELDQPIPGVKPYRVDPSQEFKKDRSVVAVGKSVDFLVKGKMVKHYADCEIGEVFPPSGGNPYYLGTYCDGSHGSSGGSLLSGNTDNPALLGLFQGGPPESDEQAIAAGKKGEPKRGVFGRKWGTGYVPVSGELLNTLLSLEPPRDAPSAPSDAIDL